MKSQKAECRICFNCKMCKGWRDVQCSKDHWNGTAGNEKTLKVVTVLYYPSPKFLAEHKNCPDYVLA